MPKRGCQPFIADRAVWEKVTQGRAGIRWDNVVDKVWKERGGNHEEVLPMKKFGSLGVTRQK